MQTAAKYVRPLADAPAAMEGLYDIIHLDIREASEAYALRHDDVMLTMWTMMFNDIFDAEGGRSPRRDEMVRKAYVSYFKGD